MEVKCCICNKVFEKNDEESNGGDARIENTVGGGDICWICPECSDKTNDL
ncbi:MAG: hypothetical protein R6U35_01230 [Candidatus Humimicrobiaceae bacterium]